MPKELFDPHKVQSFSDLPEDKKSEFVQVEDGGFVSKSAKEYGESFQQEAEGINSERRRLNAESVAKNKERALLEKLLRIAYKRPLKEIKYMDLIHDEAKKEDSYRNRQAEEGGKVIEKDVYQQEAEKHGTTRLQESIKTSLGAVVYSNEPGEPATAALNLFWKIKYGQSLTDSTVAELERNAGPELIDKLRSIAKEIGPLGLEEEEYGDKFKEEMVTKTWTIWRESVIPLLIEVLKKSGKF